jgi:hypothetical protein
VHALNKTNDATNQHFSMIPPRNSRTRKRTARFSDAAVSHALAVFVAASYEPSAALLDREKARRSNNGVDHTPGGKSISDTSQDAGPAQRRIEVSSI